MLAQKIMAIYPAIKKSDFGPMGVIRLQDDGNGPYIAAWNYAGLEQPTQEQLDAASGEAPPAVPESITRRQCALGLLSAGIITGQEAVEMARAGVPPAAVQAVFDAMQEPQKTITLIDFAAANYYRSNPLVPSLMTANGMQESDVDAFFVAAASL